MWCDQALRDDRKNKKSKKAICSFRSGIALHIFYNAQISAVSKKKDKTNIHS